MNYYGDSKLLRRSIFNTALSFGLPLESSKEGLSLFDLLFSLSFPRILWVRQLQKILGSFEVFPDKNPKIKERKDRIFTERQRHLRDCSRKEA